MTSRPATWIVALAVILSACAGIPSSGPVTKVDDVTGVGGSTVRYSPVGPVDGASPEQIVRGFLDAMLAYPASTGTASSFLVPASAKMWNPAAGTTIYSEPVVSGREPSSQGLDDAAGSRRAAVDVRLSFTREANLDAQGRYTRKGQQDATTFSLQRVDGEWRIVDPPNGLMINTKFFADYLRPFNLYFFDRPGMRLVPDPVHLVVGDQLASSLVTNLARGLTAPLDRSSRTYLPPLAATRTSVPVTRDGVAEVEFTVDLSDIGDSARDRMSAQIVWTLRQVPSITAVQVLGATMSLLNARLAAQPISSWGGFGPAISRGRAYAVVDNRVVTLDGGEVTPVKGAWGRDARQAETIAVADDSVAGVLPQGDLVRVTDREGSNAITVSGDSFIAPTWDGDAMLWLVDQGPDGTRVRIGEADGVRTVKDTDLAGLDVESFAVSPDGTRYVVAVGRGADRELRVGPIVRDAKDQVRSLGDSQRVRTTAQRPRAVSWVSSTQLAFLAAGDPGLQVTLAAIDGSQTSDATDRGAAALPDVGINSLVIGVGEQADQYATDDTGRLWFRPGEGAWRVVAGAKVTALAHGG